MQKDEIGTEESFFGQISKTRENPKRRDVKASLLKKLGLPHRWARVGAIHTTHKGWSHILRLLVTILYTCKL